MPLCNWNIKRASRFPTEFINQKSDFSLHIKKSIATTHSFHHQWTYCSWKQVYLSCLLNKSQEVLPAYFNSVVLQFGYLSQLSHVLTHMQIFMQNQICFLFYYSSNHQLMFTKLFEKGKGKIKCRIHVVQVCLICAMQKKNSTFWDVYTEVSTICN